MCDSVISDIVFSWRLIWFHPGRAQDIIHLDMGIISFDQPDIGIDYSAVVKRSVAILVLHRLPVKEINETVHQYCGTAACSLFLDLFLQVEQRAQMFDVMVKIFDIQHEHIIGLAAIKAIGFRI